MQGAELLQNPEFAQTLEQSPFQAKDLPGLSTGIADAFDRLTPTQRSDLKKAMAELEALSEEELMSFLRMISYVEQYPEQYPKLVQQLVSSGAFEAGDVPEQYDPNLMGVVKALVGQALMKVRGPQKPAGFAKGGIATLKGQAKNVASAGREGDTVLAHINPFEASILKKMGGKGTINPETGLPEFGFFSSLGNILKIGATIVGAAVLTPFVGPIAAGALASGATSLLSGAKPADALKSALIGGALGGISAGFTGSGSFAENGFAGGTVFGGAPAQSPLLDWMKSTSVGERFLGGIPSGAEGAVNPATVGAPLPPVRPSDIPLSGAAEAGAAGAGGTVAPSVGISGLMDKASAFAKEYKWPLLIGGGAALIGMSNSQKENVKPSLIKGPTGSELLAQQPGTYGFNVANFSQRTPSAANPVFPGGNYVAPTVPTGAAPIFDYGRVRYPTTGIMNAKVGGHISGPGDGTSDSIPARLSDGEFVMTAKAVRGAGKGDRMKGARKMYEMMHKLERMA